MLIALTCDHLILAEAYGMPMWLAYLNLIEGQDIKKEVNFAFVGSTALDKNFLEQKRINKEEVAYLVSAQLD